MNLHVVPPVKWKFVWHTTGDIIWTSECVLDTHLSCYAHHMCVMHTVCSHTLSRTALYSYLVHIIFVIEMEGYYCS